MKIKCNKCDRIQTSGQVYWRASEIQKMGDLYGEPGSEYKYYCDNDWKAVESNYQHNPKLGKDVSSNIFKYSIETYPEGKRYYYYEDTKEWKEMTRETLYGLEEEEREKKEALEKYKKEHFGLTPNQYQLLLIGGSILSVILIIVVLKWLFSSKKKRHRTRVNNYHTCCSK